MIGDIEPSDAEDAAPVPLFGPIFLPNAVPDAKSSRATSSGETSCGSTGESSCSGDDDSSSPAGKPTNRWSRHGRRQLPNYLPTENIVLEPERALVGGEVLREEITMRLGFRPAQLIRLRVVRPVIVVAATDEPSSEAIVAHTPQPGAPHSLVPFVRIPAELRTIVRAPMPREMIERGLPTCTLLVFVVVSKYLDHLPLNRLQGIFQRQGFGVARGTMVGWLQRCFDLVKCLVDAWFVDAMHRSRVIGSDATGVLVQDEKRCRRGHFWVFVADAGYVLFNYSDRHTHKEPLKFFESFGGVALVDAAPVFDRMFNAEGGPIEAVCWAHARRYLIRAISSHSELAPVGIGYCNRLFEFERHLVEHTSERRLEERQRICRPVVEHFYAWLGGLGDSIESGSLMAKARTYFTNQKAALHTFLSDGRVKIHNNSSELNLRSVVVGRANWLFVGTMVVVTVTRPTSRS